MRARWRGRVADEPLEVVAGLAARARRADASLREAIASARDQGRSWEDIGRALGVTKQTAWQKYAKGGSVSSSSVAESVTQCSFCGRSRKETKQLVVAPSGSSICDECVDLAAHMVRKEKGES